MKKDGFTLLEVMLFMAISSSLALIAFASMGPRLRNVRFTDSIRGLESNLQSNLYEQSNKLVSQAGKVCKRSGTSVLIEDGSAPTGTSSDCVVNGRVAYLESNRVTYRDIVSLREPLGCPGESYDSDLQQVVKCFSSVVSPKDAIEIYPYTNGLKRSSAPASPAIAVLSNPKTNETYRLQIQNTAYSWLFYGALSNSVYRLSQDKAVPFCFTNQGREAKLSFSSNNSALIVDFNESCT